jgi:20S proteasome alpha/beta subunit
LGICAKDGVVIATDKKFSSTLVDTDHVQKVEPITSSTGFVYAGVGPDYRVLGTMFNMVLVVSMDSTRTHQTDSFFL